MAFCFLGPISNNDDDDDDDDDDVTTIIIMCLVLRCKLPSGPFTFNQLIVITIPASILRC